MTPSERAVVPLPLAPALRGLLATEAASALTGRPSHGLLDLDHLPVRAEPDGVRLRPAAEDLVRDREDDLAGVREPLLPDLEGRILEDGGEDRAVAGVCEDR